MTDPNNTDNTETPTVSSLLPADTRYKIYAVLVIVNAMLGAAEAAYPQMPRWTTIITAGINAAGFYMANRNTPQ